MSWIARAFVGLSNKALNYSKTVDTRHDECANGSTVITDAQDIVCASAIHLRPGLHKSNAIIEPTNPYVGLAIDGISVRYAA